MRFCQTNVGDGSGKISPGNRWPLLVIVALIAAPSGGDSFGQTPETKPPTNAAPGLSEDQQMTFVRAIQKALKNGDQKQFDAAIDWDQNLDIATAGGDSPEINVRRKGFKSGSLKGIAWAKSSIGRMVFASQKQGGTYRFVKLAKHDGQPVAIFRFLAPNYALDYHRYYLNRSSDGRVRAKDVYLFGRMELVSESTRRDWLASIAKPSTFKELTAPDPRTDALKSASDWFRLIEENQRQKVLEALNKLPEEIQKENVFLILRVMAALQVSDDEYSKAVNELKQALAAGGDSPDILLLNGYLRKQQYEKAFECAVRANESIGGDAWLMSIQGMFLTRMDRYEEGRKIARQAITMEPDFQPLYSAALGLSLAAKNNSDIASDLTMIETKLGIKMNDIQKDPAYADFVKSPEYSKWLKSRK